MQKTYRTIVSFSLHLHKANLFTAVLKISIKPIYAKLYSYGLSISQPIVNISEGIKQNIYFACPPTPPFRYIYGNSIFSHWSIIWWNRHLQAASHQVLRHSWIERATVVICDFSTQNKLNDLINSSNTQRPAEP